MLLYKYYPCNEYTFRSLARNGLWCHYPKNMNDPFECLAQVERKIPEQEIAEFLHHINKNKIKSLEKYLRMGFPQIEKLLNEIRTGSISKYAFCALSQKYDDILMWSHYANSHKGIVVGFEFDRIDDRKVFQKVTYENELEPFDLIAFADFMNGVDENLPMFIKDISIKGKPWEYENEWRIWQMSPGYFGYKPNEVKEIYLGVGMDEEMEIVVWNLIKQFNDAKIYKMEFRDNPLRLVRE